MKLIQTLLITGALLLGGSAMAQNIVTAEQVQVTINGSTTRESLAQMRQDLQAVGLEFRYQPQFDNDRHLTGISFMIHDLTSGQEFGGASEDNFMNPSKYTSFRMTKAEGAWATQCFGVCN